MKKIAFVLAAAASFASAPAQATFWVQHGHGDYGCGGQGHQGCESPLQGDYTYDGNGGVIADLPFLNPLTSSINVGESFDIADVNVSLNELDHARWSDLKISLSHDGQVVWLTYEQGGSKKADGTFIFDDEASNLISGTGNNWKPGTYNPAGSLSDFNGLDSAGKWTLNIYDTKFNFKTGDLCDWTLQLTPTSAVPEPATWAMMIAGFGMVGAQLRRRRTGPVAVRA